MRVGFIMVYLSLVAAALSCGTTYTPPPSGPPASEMVAKMDSADFWVVFDAKPKSGARSKEFSWIKVGATSRWDLVSSHRRLLFGETTLEDRSRGDGWTCDWAIKDGTRADSTCDGYPWAAVSALALVEKLTDGRWLPKDAGPTSIREVLGIEAFCYEAVQPLPVRGRVCISPDGVPLAIDASSQVGGGRFEIHVVADAVREVPVGDGWKQRVSQVEIERDVAPTTLHFPDLPLMSKWKAESD